MKWFSHACVILLVVLTILGSAIGVEPIRSAKAESVVTTTSEPRLITSSPVAVAADRSFLSARTESLPQPTPLPTPYPLDPNATPLAAPTPKPVLAVAPAPVAAVVKNPGTWPVAGGGISQYFSAGHPALDIYAACLTPIVATYSGTLTYAGWKNNGGGNVVTIVADAGFTIEYNHLNSFGVLGGYVPVGTVIGYVGASGWATGCHVHIAISVNGQWVDPLAYF